MIKQGITYLSLVSLLLLSGCAFFQSSYPAQNDALQALNYSKETDYGWLFEPTDAEIIGQLIFYPGGKVKPEAYSALAYDLANAGLAVSLVKFPLDLAVFNSKAANAIVDPLLPTFIAGHSLGGAMAANYSKDNLGSIDGLILLAAYSLERYNLQTSSLPVLSIYASNDLVATIEEIDDRRQWMPQSAQYFRIEGGNHAQFGDYGDQKDDGIAAITGPEQRQQTVDAIANFIAALVAAQ